MTVYELRFLIVYILIPAVVLLLFFLWKPGCVFLAVPICAVPNLLLHVQEILYYESRGLILLCVAAQAGVTAILAFVIRDFARKR